MSENIIFIFHSSWHIVTFLILLRYTLGQDLPIQRYYNEMVSSPDKKSIYVIGGDGSKAANDDIYKFSCTGAINTCKWTKSKTALKYGRRNFVALPISNYLADKLCK